MRWVRTIPDRTLAPCSCFCLKPLCLSDIISGNTATLPLKTLGHHPVAAHQQTGGLLEFTHDLV